jgi:hypothetical protein
MFELKRKYVMDEWKKIHHEELRNLYPSPNIFLEKSNERVWDRWGLWHPLGQREM